MLDESWVGWNGCDWYFPAHCNDDRRIHMTTTHVMKQRPKERPSSAAVTSRRGARLLRTRPVLVPESSQVVVHLFSSKLSLPLSIQNLELYIQELCDCPDWAVSEHHDELQALGIIEENQVVHLVRIPLLHIAWECVCT